MKSSREQFYAIFQLSIPNTLGRKNRKKIVYEVAPAHVKRGANLELPEEFSTWLDHETSSLESQYPGETIDLLEADIAENMHEVRSIIFQEGIAQGDILKRSRDPEEEE